jgi:hypothetical protein
VAKKSAGRKGHEPAYIEPVINDAIAEEIAPACVELDTLFKLDRIYQREVSVLSSKRTQQQKVEEMRKLSSLRDHVLKKIPKSRLHGTVERMKALEDPAMRKSIKEMNRLHREHKLSGR